VNKFKITHIFNDDQFIDPAIKLFESVVPNRSTYFVLKQTSTSFKYIKSNKVEALPMRNEKDEFQFVNYIHKNEISVIFFHALNSKNQRLVNLLGNKIVKVWFIWGYDFYQSWDLINRKLYEPITNKFLYNRWCYCKKKIIFNEFSFWLFSKFKYRKYLLPKKINNILDSNYLTEFYKATKKIDIVVPVVPTEYNLVKKMGINPIYAPFTYGCLEDILGNKIKDNVLKAKNILIGNSANPTNNHVDVFKRLAKFDFKDRKIYVPLNYSGSKEYINFVKEKGYYYFGDNFKPILDFLPLEEYNKLISSCNVAIFNHIRQQAVGNIIALGYLGAKIFLNEKSPVFKYYKNLGININSIKDISQVNIDTNLSFNEFENNKRIIFDIYSRNAVQNKIKILLSTVQEKLSGK